MPNRRGRVYHHSETEWMKSSASCLSPTPSLRYTLPSTSATSSRVSASSSWIVSKPCSSTYRMSAPSSRRSSPQSSAASRHLQRSAVSPAAAGDTALRCKCRLAAELCGLDRRELGALILYVEEHGFETIQDELALTRDEVADVLGSVYRKLGVGDKQEALDFIHSVSE